MCVSDWLKNIMILGTAVLIEVHEVSLEVSFFIKVHANKSWDIELPSIYGSKNNGKNLYECGYAMSYYKFL